jgi:hypothetical protein
MQDQIESMSDIRSRLLARAYSQVVRDARFGSESQKLIERLPSDLERLF